MATGALAKVTRWFLTDNGIASPGAKAYFFASGTATPQPVYTDEALTIAHAHPVVADAEGVLPVIFLSPVAYRLTITDAVGVTIFPAQDNILEVADVALATTVAANLVQAGPTTGAAALPTYRALVLADLPVAAAVAANTGYLGPASGANAVPAFRAFVAADLPAGVVRILNKAVVLVDVHTSTAETDVYSFPIVANTLSATGVLRLLMISDYLNNSGGNANLTGKVKLGGATYFSFTVTIGASATRGMQALEVLIAAANATNAQRASARWITSEGSENNAAGNLTIASATNRHLSGVHNAMTEDMTTSKTISVTVQHSVSASTISFRAHAVTLELLP